MQIFILIDCSGSMNEVWYDDNQEKRKVDNVKEHLITYLSSVNISEPSKVHIYSFNTTSRLLATEDLNNVAEKLDSLKIDCDGGTKVWDSIHSIIDMKAKETGETVKIICLTDGEDVSSKHSFRSIKQAVKNYPHIELLIIDVDGKLSEVIGDDELIKTVTRKRNIRNILNESEIIEDSKYSLNRLDISVSIIPAVPCSKDDINMTSKLVKEVIPYLEELSGLRYYPVPTYLIDEYTLDLYLEKPLPDNMDKDKLYEVICELIRFYEGASLGLHASLHNDDRTISAMEHKSWGRYFKWSEDSKRTVLHMCEVFLGVPEYMKNGKFDAYLSSLLQLPELLYLNHNIEKIEKTMRGLVDYYRELKEIYGKENSLHAYYFSSNSYLVWNKTMDYPDLKIWKSYFSRSDFSKIRKCIEEDGSWKKDLESISSVYEIALPVIIELLKNWENVSSKWSLIAESIRTFGVYLPRKNASDQQLNKALQYQGYPAIFNQYDTGKVLLCIDRCKNRLEEYWKQHKNESINSIKSEALFSGLLKATLLHEHAHAITYEGVGKGEDQYFISNKRDSAVSEALAEWAELNYFRANETRDIYEIVYNHANSGAFPDWPYAGALILENSNERLPKTIRFRSLLQYYRSDAEIAFSLLDSW